jgi:pantetheine-phosphate adenylyltransferase
VDAFEGLTVEYMKQNQAKIIIRGLRAVVDFEYEITMSSMNKKLAPDIETLLVFARPEYYFISSRGVKEVALNHGDLSGLVPKVVEDALRARYKK